MTGEDEEEKGRYGLSGSHEFSRLDSTAHGYTCREGPKKPKVEANQPSVAGTTAHKTHFSPLRSSRTTSSTHRSQALPAREERPVCVCPRSQEAVLHGRNPKKWPEQKKHIGKERK